MALWIVGCGQPDGTAGTADEGEATVEPARTTASLPVSLNEVMVALVNDAADPIWIAAWRNPTRDADWRRIERKAYQLEVAGALLTLPGTGPNDRAWIENPAWTTWSAALQRTGAVAVAAAKSRDIEALSRAGDEIVEAREGCHIAFKPDVPTGGIFGELSPTEDDFGTAAADYDGLALYTANCASCHGVRGEGNGVAVQLSFNPPQDMRYIAERNDGEFPHAFVAEIIDGRATRAAHGPEGMPAWGVEFSRMEGFDEAANARVAAKIDALVSFIESLQIVSED